VYNNNQQAEKNFIVYALFISFFPELPSGPIDRAQNLIPQFYEKHDFNYDDITGGLKLMAWGFFKKLVIADRLAILVNQIYGNLTDYTGIPLIIAVVFFAFQIYCDFSGYTDIAIGSGMVLGFKLMNNFDRPYFSRSISEFWRKWHISLTSWLRDYVFMPVAYSVSSRIKKRSYLGVKKESLSYAVATFVTMLIAGLWHGAGWTFVIWGIIFAVYMIFSHFTKKARKKISGALGLNNVPRIHDYFKLLITFCLLCLVWIFFRAYNLNDALYVITHMFSGIGLKLSGNKLGPSNFDMALSIILIFTLLFTEALLKKDETITDFIARKPAWLRWTVYYTLLFLILAFGEFGYNKFIYFQF
jgi:D-alanyl-lipoteichoic acid acyltransferase DltB (MBOAT superfamily)